VAQAMLINADNYRFSIPLQAIIVYVVVLWSWSLVKARLSPTGPRG
jgi:hypothetical protein